MSESSLQTSARPAPAARSDSTTLRDRRIANWLYVVVGLAMFLVVFGGFVRLTRAGLSIVEWNPVSGVVPPIGQQAWQEEFAKYQQTPEFQKVNFAMTLADYKEIFYIEYIHRLIARFAGLIVVIPLFWYLWKGIIPWRKSAIYLFIAALFAFQGFMGWYMVSSGLVDRPHVSHYRLTIHLLLALSLIGIALWTGLNNDPRVPLATRRLGRSTSSKWALALFVILVLQIAYGGLVAGLKAGHASNTWPLMFGYLIPPGLLSVVQPWWQNLLETAATVQWVHRWFAFAVLIMAGILYYLAVRRQESPAARRAITLLFGLVGVQILLGISVIWFGVPIAIALLHQAMALLLYVTTVFLNHRLLREP